MTLKTTSVWTAVAVMALLASANGQQEGERPRDGDRPPREGQRERGPRDGERPEGRGFRPVLPLMIALDTNKDGKLSTDEVAKATASLQKLDKNEDGVIDEQELRPEPPAGADRERGPRDEDRPRPDGDRPPREGDRPRGDGERGPQGRGPGGPGGGPAGFVDRLMQADTDKDGKLSREELQKAAENFGRDRGGREGGGDRPNRPE